MTRTHRNITITENYNGYNGLELSYIYYGIEKSRDLSREETMNILSDIITIKDGMVLEEDRWISFEDWREMELLTEDDLKNIVMRIESAEQMKSTCKRINSAA